MSASSEPCTISVGWETWLGSGFGSLRWASPAMASYMAGYALLEMEIPAAREGFAEVLRIKPDDPLSIFHLNRMDKGETGVSIVMAEK